MGRNRIIAFTETFDAAESLFTGNLVINNPVVSIIEMICVPGGTFELGRHLGTGNGWDETPISEVTLTGFYMGKYEVTQEQWAKVMTGNTNGISATPSYFSGSPASLETQNRHPVERVSWYDVIVFCNRLSIQEGLIPAYSIEGSDNPNNWGEAPYWTTSTVWDTVQIVIGSNGYRLPTEAQWEYAAKGGNPDAPGWAAYTHSGSDNPDAVAWYWDNSNEMPHEVGNKAPNGLGLYDMSGNIWEWCWDWWGTYPSGAQTDPVGAPSGSFRTRRGGSWLNLAGALRSGFRFYGYPNGRDDNLGFRVLRL